MTTIVKIGGSVLRTENDYARIARSLVPRLDTEATWIVVSAAHGVTDRLQAIANGNEDGQVAALLEQQARVSGSPRFPTLEEELRSGLVEAREGRPNRLLSWGEQASASALRGHLARLGYDVPVVELTARQKPPPHWAAIVPGFYLRDRHGRARTLPRGGTDISALLLAVKLGVRRVHFWKEGGGIRTEATSDSWITELDAETLLKRIGHTIRPLHPATVRIALKHGIELVLEDADGRHPATRVLPQRAPVLALA